MEIHFGNFVLDNSNRDKISHSLAKKIQYLEQSAALSEMKEITLNHIFLSKIWYIGEIYTIPKFIKKEIEKTMSQCSIWKCGLRILEIDTQFL